jgi:dienelactone hydrolase
MIKTSVLTYEADGARMMGYLAVDDARSGERPAVLIAPEAPGLDDYNRERCRRMAALGLVALTLDFHGEGFVFADRERMTSNVRTFMAEPLRIRARAEAALAALRSLSGVDAARIAAVGYCFGGTIVLELARGGADIKAVVAFHAGLSTARPQDASDIKAKILVCNGADDPLVKAEERLAFEREMTAGKVDWRLYLHGGVGHAFTRRGSEALGLPGFGYDESADERSWQAMLELLRETLVIETQG